jgi:hypothetical protein
MNSVIQKKSPFLRGREAEGTVHRENFMPYSKLRNYCRTAAEHTTRRSHAPFRTAMP